MTRSRITKGVLFFCAAFTFILVFSKSTSPLFPNEIGIDSGIFMTIGKAWANGAVPYIRLWDQKGPIIFAINALGWTIFDNWYGLFAIQVLCMFLTLIIVYKTLRTAYAEKPACVLTLILVFLLRIDYIGNSTEEYLLPLLCLSFLKILQYTKQLHTKDINHKPTCALLYGVTFSFCLLTRLTNALGLSAAVSVIAINLTVHGKWRNLLDNAMAFIAGVFILLIPFVVYFSSYGALPDFIYGTIGYNLDYFSASSMGSLSLYSMIRFILRFGISAVLLIIGLLEIMEREANHLCGWIWFCSGALTLLWFIKSRAYEHYGMIAFPYFALSMIEIKRMSVYSAQKIKWNSVRILLCVFFCTIAMGSVAFSKAEFERIDDGVDSQRVLSEMISVIPPEEKDSIVAYNVHPKFYILQDIQPCYRFFALQDKQASVSLSMMKMLRNTYSEKTAKWILFEGNPDISYITDILKNDYTVNRKLYDPETKKEIYLYSRK